MKADKTERRNICFINIIIINRTIMYMHTSNCSYYKVTLGICCESTKIHIAHHALKNVYCLCPQLQALRNDLQ